MNGDPRLCRGAREPHFGQPAFPRQPVRYAEATYPKSVKSSASFRLRATGKSSDWQLPMSKIVIISCVFPPETSTAGINCQDLASHMASDGHDVSVLCPLPSRPLGSRYPAFEDRTRIDVRREGAITVIRLPSFAAPQSRLWPRFRESYSFGVVASRYLARHLADSDVVYSLSWPLIGQRLVSKTLVKMGIPLVLNVQDIYPESLLQKLPTLIRRLVRDPLMAWERAIVHRACGVVVISPNMRRVYLDSRHVPTSRIVVIPTWHDEGLFWPLPKRAVAAGRYCVPQDLFTFLYLGNIGPVAGVEDAIRAFCAASVGSTQLVIVGEGSRKAACQDIAERSGCPRILFLSDPEVSNVPLLQSLADVCVLPVRRGAAFTSVPSKLISYLFSANPVLGLVDSGSDSERTIREADCGWVVEPGNIHAAAEQIRRVASIRPDELQRLGTNGRAYGLGHFSKKSCVPALAKAIERFAGLDRKSPRSRCISNSVQLTAAGL